MTLEGLPPATSLTLRIDGAGAVVTGTAGDRLVTRPIPRTWRELPFRTLASPPGEEVFRFATISDLHVGDITFGYRQTLVERPVPDEAHPQRATRAAITALSDWGAALLVVKGDLTATAMAKDWAATGQVLSSSPVPVHLLPGNHDHYGAPGEPEPYRALDPYGLTMTNDVDVVELPGLTLLLLDSTATGQPLGHVAHRQERALTALAAARSPAFVATHHHVQRLPVPTFWPPGIPSFEAERFIDAIARVHPATMISSGHTHRHRRRQIGPVVLTEVGSPKDYPGTWAGYVVHEGGIRQTVRRVSPPDLLRWTDHSARAAWHAWGVWSPGRLSDRCFSHTWPT